MKKIKIILLLTILMLFTKQIHAADYKIKSVDISAMVLDNGNVQVTETITGDFTNKEAFIRSIPKKVIDKYEDYEIEKNIKELNKQFENKEILSLSVKEKDINGAMYNYTLNQDFISGENRSKVYKVDKYTDFRYIEVGINTDTTNSKKRTFVISYVLQDAVIKYNDTAEFYWNFLGDVFNTKIDKLDIKITFPQNQDASSLKYFLHGAKAKNYKIENNKTIHISLNNVKKYNYITTRVLFPSYQVSTCTNVVDYNAISMIEQIENELFKRNNKTF